MDILILENWRELLSLIAVVVGIGGYIPYFASIFSGRTKPHLYSWGTWTFIGCISFSAQVSGGGGWGSAMLGMTAIICGVISLLAFRYGEKTGDSIDIASVILAVLAIGLWAFTNNPLYATIFATLADSICYIPTFRKLWRHPKSEPILYYTLSTAKHSLALIALSAYTPTTMMFSLSVIGMNLIVFSILFVRRR